MAVFEGNLDRVFYSQILPLVVASQEGDLEAQETMLKHMMFVSKRWRTWAVGSTPWIRHLLRDLNQTVTEAQQELDLAIMQSKLQQESDALPSKKRRYIVTLDDLLDNELYALPVIAEKRSKLL